MRPAVADVGGETLHRFDSPRPKTVLVSATAETQNLGAEFKISRNFVLTSFARILVTLKQGFLDADLSFRNIAEKHRKT